MILIIKHKGLRAFWEKGDARKINPDLQQRLDRIMNALVLAQTPTDVDFPGWRLHPLTGEFKGYYSVSISGNWRIVFRFDRNNATDINLIDYH